jgi:hypothetical protein
MVATLLKEVETRKKQTEKSLSTKVQEARDRLDAQAKTEHDKFTAMSANNMSQHTANLQNLCSNKLQELANTTANWQSKFESAMTAVQSAQGKIFEKNCQETRKQENQKVEKMHRQQETKLQQKAAETEKHLMMAEAGMVLQAQSPLDQLPMDMGTAKDEIETELREHGDAVQQGVEEMQARHKQETDEQVTAHKTSLHSLIGPSRERNTLPTPAQHAARATLRNEIATALACDSGAQRQSMLHVCATGPTTQQSTRHPLKHSRDSNPAVGTCSRTDAPSLQRNHRAQPIPTPTKVCF